MTDQDTRKASFYNYKNGVIFEEKAKKYLQRYGYKIIETRYKNNYGEIDIVAEESYLRENILKNGFNFNSHKKCLVFVEVKSRKSDELIESILRRAQIKRIKNSASYFLSKHDGYQNHDIRFDFILFTNSKEMAHHKNYF